MSRRPFTAVLLANTISIAGSSLTLIGVPWFVLQTTGSAGQAGIVAFCATLPVAVAALVGGPVIDRLGRRRVSAASDLICGLSVAAIPLLHYAGLLEFWMLCALMAVGGLVHTPDSPRATSCSPTSPSTPAPPWPAPPASTTPSRAEPA